MFGLIVICILIVQLLIFINRYKYFLMPPIVLTSIWLLVHILNFVLGWQVEEIEYLILALPPLMFGIGFYFVNKTRVCFRRDIDKYQRKQVQYNEDFLINYNLLYIILLIDVILMLLSLQSASAVMANLTNANFWLNVHQSASLVEGNFIVSYSTPAAYIFSGFCGLIYTRKKSYKNLGIYITAVLIALIRSFMSGNRTAILMVIIVNLFPMLLSMEKGDGSNKSKVRKKTRRLILFAIIMAAVMFFGIASQKYVDQFSSLSIRDFIIKNFTGYFNLSSAAFVEWYKRGFVHTNGANTFRFIYAVLERIGIQVPVADINADFIFVEGTVTNVYTIAKTYIEDYGIVYMAFMLFLFGAIHAHFYKKAFSNNLYKRVSGQLYCGVMYIGLLYQINSDQYVTSMSMMVNFYIWSIVFPRLVIKSKRT